MENKQCFNYVFSTLEVRIFCSDSQFRARILCSGHFKWKEVAFNTSDHCQETLLELRFKLQKVRQKSIGLTLTENLLKNWLVWYWSWRPLSPWYGRYCSEDRSQPAAAKGSIIFVSPVHKRQHSFKFCAKQGSLGSEQIGQASCRFKSGAWQRGLARRDLGKNAVHAAHGFSWAWCLPLLEFFCSWFSQWRQPQGHPRISKISTKQEAHFVHNFVSMGKSGGRAYK